MAFVGDVMPYERRQQVLGRFLSGQILGQLFGQAAGGVLGDWFGWRNVFFLLAGLLALAAVGAVVRVAAQSDHACAATPARSPVARLRRRLFDRAALALGARHDRRWRSSRAA